MSARTLRRGPDRAARATIADQTPPMRALFRSLVALAGLVLAPAVASVSSGCDGASIDRAPVPGISEGTADLIEVFAVDLDSRAPLAAARVTVQPLLGAATAAVADAAGLATFERDGAGVYSVEVQASGYVPARWTGIVGGRVTVPLRRAPAEAAFAVSVGGLASGETAAVSLTSRSSLVQGTSVRLASAEGATVVECVPGVGASDACTATLRGEDPAGGRLVLVSVRDASGAAARLVRFDGVAAGDTLDLGPRGGGLDVPLATLAVLAPEPPGSLGPVGVTSAISFGASVGLLGFALEGTSVALPVPDVTDLLATRWVLFTSTAIVAGAPVPGRRSVLVDRRAESTAGPWAGWLAPPVLFAAPGVTSTALLEPSPGASIHVVEWLDAAGRPLRADLVLDPDTPLSRPEGARRAWVRAIDTPGVSSAALALDAAERATVRFAEDDVTFPL